MINVKIIADSVSAETRKRIITYELQYPRFIHAEFMTHRVFSRNASSSRAIPVKRIIEEVRNNFAAPIKFHKNKRGMQGGDECDSLHQDLLFEEWRKAANQAADTAEKMDRLGAHKQYVNRILEPFCHIKVVVTSTEWANFFALRYHSMAQPEICHLAKLMFQAKEASQPKVLKLGEWHLPYVNEEAEKLACEYYTNSRLNGNKLDLTRIKIKMSVARCARVSYNNHDGSQSSVLKDLQLYDRLLGSQPIHASPAEHQATPLSCLWASSKKEGNFREWVQYRKTLQGENIDEFAPGKYE